MPTNKYKTNIALIRESFRLEDPAHIEINELKNIAKHCKNTDNSTLRMTSRDFEIMLSAAHTEQQIYNVRRDYIRVLQNYRILRR
jgi:hypothetical protein